MNVAEGGYAIYPSGFATFSVEATGTTAVESDVETATLYVGMIDGHIPAFGPDHFVRVMKLATRMLGGGSRWLQIQRYNKNLEKVQVDFIVDTINYIQTGRRSMYPQGWLSLCDEPNRDPIKSIVMGGAAANPQIVVPEAMAKCEPSQIVARWISHDGGLSDMICALNIMFGGIPYIRGTTAPTL